MESKENAQKIIDVLQKMAGEPGGASIPAEAYAYANIKMLVIVIEQLQEISDRLESIRHNTSDDW